MSINVNVAFRNVLASQARDIFNGGTIQIRSGPKPDAGSPVSGTLLATLTIPSGWFSSAAGGVTSGATQITAEVAVTGTAGHARIAGSSSVINVDVTNTGGSGPFRLDTTSLEAGGFIRLNSGSITFPAT